MDTDIPDFSHLPVTIRRWKFVKRQTIEIERGLVRVTEKGLGATKWEEPLSRFRCIRLRTKFSLGGEAGHGGTYYRIELEHPVPRKTVMLCEITKEEKARKIWKDAALRFNLPPYYTPFLPDHLINT